MITKARFREKSILKTDWDDFTKKLARLGIFITSEQLTKFQQYYELLLKWNQKINLISRQDIDRIISYHFIDSLSAINELPTNSVVGDFGSGAGFPGIPLKIIRDDITLYLIESIQKKAAFLNLIKEELNLKNITVIAQRGEKVTNLKCDIILVRLLGRIEKVLPMVLPILKPKGKIIFYKSKTAEQEIAEANKILTKFSLKPKIKAVPLPQTEIIRRLICLER